MTRVSCSPDVEGATVVEVPLESLRRGGLFTPPALDAFLRVLSVGSVANPHTKHDSDKNPATAISRTGGDSSPKEKKGGGGAVGGSGDGARGGGEMVG